MSLGNRQDGLPHFKGNILAIATACVHTYVYIHCCASIALATCRKDYYKSHWNELHVVEGVQAAFSEQQHWMTPSVIASCIAQCFASYSKLFT